MIKIKEAIIVEGKYDKIKLSSIVEGLIIETRGFQIFKDKEKLSLIQKLAKQRGILVLTDSDSAGFMIRNYLSGAVPQENIKQAYIPDLYGKEKRKEKPSKEGKLGVEGVSEEIILDAIRRAGVLVETDERKQEGRNITKIDLYEDGLSGREDSKEKRREFLKLLGLPEHLSVNCLLEVLNGMLSFEEYKNALTRLNTEQ